MITGEHSRSFYSVCNATLSCHNICTMHKQWRSTLIYQLRDLVLLHAAASHLHSSCFISSQQLLQTFTAAALHLHSSCFTASQQLQASHDPLSNSAVKATKHSSAMISRCPLAHFSLIFKAQPFDLQALVASFLVADHACRSASNISVPTCAVVLLSSGEHQDIFVCCADFEMTVHRTPRSSHNCTFYSLRFCLTQASLSWTVYQSMQFWCPHFIVQSVAMNVF